VEGMDRRMNRLQSSTLFPSQNQAPPSPQRSTKTPPTSVAAFLQQHHEAILLSSLEMGRREVERSVKERHLTRMKEDWESMIQLPHSQPVY